MEGVELEKKQAENYMCAREKMRERQSLRGSKLSIMALDIPVARLLLSAAQKRVIKGRHIDRTLGYISLFLGGTNRWIDWSSPAFSLVKAYKSQDHDVRSVRFGSGPSLALDDANCRPNGLPIRQGPGRGSRAGTGRG